MQSFFQNLYKYKQSEQRHQKENFITEILSYCLENDIVFGKKFLNKIDGNILFQKPTCRTQFLDTKFGKPDILIELNNTIILIECKVDASQGNNQLNRYAQYLRKQKIRNKHFIFLTKYFEDVNNKLFKDLNFRSMRWYEVFELLQPSSNIISKEFSKYLIEQKMSTKISFNKADISALKYINETVAKMDEFLVRLEELLSRQCKNKVVQDRNTFQGYYGVYTKIKVGVLWLGFYQFDSYEEMQVGISVEALCKSQFEKQIDKLSKFNNWELPYIENNYKIWYNGKKISTFFSNNTFSANEAFNFLEFQFEKIKKLL